MDRTFRVVGVLAPKGQTGSGQDQDDVIIMPWTTAQKKLKGRGYEWLDDVLCSAVSPEAVDPAVDAITTLMRQRHHIQPGAPDDFNLRNPTEIAETLAASARTMEGLLASVASVSLLIGGVGIMNIMLVSVSERTREIGLRLAIGARNRDVLRQFLCEAVVLSMSGGLIGIGLGVAASHVISDLFGWATRVSPNAIALSVLFALVIGIFFGYYPATRAATLDPIEALRYE